MTSLPHTQSLSIVVSSVYDALFDRSPDAGGFTHWSAQVAGGATTQDLASAFMASDEWTLRHGTGLGDDAFLTLLYGNLFSRAPDMDGWSHWTGQLGMGMSRAEVVERFITSAEYSKDVVIQTAQAVEVTGIAPSTAALDGDMLGLT
jgi:hypothetical protein